ncbi:uncharacterized protein LOC131891398 isoform X2 [Tigriopus californicus]|uniref:uncharacterized protein LOC131891398 isoform X2 n=1 Tax=Tigriopus californicus TaxID=6832 RepID=UPI0027DA87F7|nr:uncharacterized protein LOC131891398 isoform X2 [Tigriopus californicus]
MTRLQWAFAFNVLFLWLNVECLNLEHFLRSEVSAIDPQVQSSLQERQPRFLIRTTSTVTATSFVSTSTACFTTAATFTAICARRKKRGFRILDAPIRGQHPAESQVQPSQSVQQKGAQEATIPEIQPSITTASREGRFFQFLFTTTLTTTTLTSTTITGTTTFTLGACQPSSFIYNAC